MSRSLSRWQAIVLGVVSLAGVTLATVGLFTVGSRQWPWNDTFDVRVGFQRIRGVEVGTRVRIQGVDAGEVIALQPPATPGRDVMLTLRLNGKWRRQNLLRADAGARIESEGMVGGRVIEIDPGTPGCEPLADNAVIRSEDSIELADAVTKVANAFKNLDSLLASLDGEKGRMTGLVENTNDLLDQGSRTLATIQKVAEAMQRLPVLRSYIEDPESLLVRPNCERHRRLLAETELFEPGRAVLTAGGCGRLDEMAAWLNSLKQKGSEVVVVAYADPKTANPAIARTVTKQQSEAVCKYLKEHGSVHKIDWRPSLLASRKVTPLGLGISSPPQPEKDHPPAARVEFLVFVPQG